MILLHIIMEYSEEDISDERLRRMDFQKKLMDRFKNSLLIMRVNYPSKHQRIDLVDNIIQKMDALVSDIFSDKIRMRVFRKTAEGPNVLMVLEQDPYEIKQLTVQIEDKHILGQCIDIDVFDVTKSRAIRRIELGIEQRCCPMCGEGLRECIVSGKHREEEVTKFINDKFREFMENFYGKTV